MNMIKKLLVSLNKTKYNIDTDIDMMAYNDKVIELDAVQRRIQNIIFNDLNRDMKTGITKMFNAYKQLQVKPDSEFSNKSRLECYHETSQQFLTTFFNTKISDFAENF